MTKLNLLSLISVSVLGMTLNAAAESPYTQYDDSYISLSGTVVSAVDDSFSLDYGEGIVTVEMDDWDWYSEGYKILEGDEVTVYGYVDDDLYETTKVEASSVYVDNLNTYFYASGTDEETIDAISTTWYDYDYTITGTVTSVSGREFTIDSGIQELTVDTWQLGYNPMDNQGYISIDEGDRVTVYGEMDLDIFENNELLAEAVIELMEDTGKGS